MIRDAAKTGIWNLLLRGGCFARLLVAAFAITVVLQTGCASCYGVRVVSRTNSVSYIDVEFGGTRVAINGGAPPSLVCETVPDKVNVTYLRAKPGSETEKERFVIPDVPVARNMPKGFPSNPARLLYFELDKDYKVRVLFNMKLSEVTTKLVAGGETADEKRQRLHDEALVLAIMNKDVEGVKRALASGASVIQPWAKFILFPDKRFYFHESPDATWVIFELAMQTRDAEIVESVGLAGAPFRDSMAGTALYHGYDYGRRWEYVSVDIARALLRIGANPDYGRPIRFDWLAHKDWPSWPGMPRNADLKEPPVDRLIYTAVAMNDPELVKVLLEYGAETHFRLPKSRKPPEWWQEGEWFLDWVTREASPEVQAVFSGMTKSKSRAVKTGGTNASVRLSFP